MLFPAAVLIVVILAAITVDSAIVFLGQREVVNSVAAAANDAATIGVSNSAFYRAGAVELDVGTVRAITEQRVRAALSGDRFHDLQVGVIVLPATAGCPPSLRVEASATVAYLFARAIPGAPARATVRAFAVAAPAAADTVGC